MNNLSSINSTQSVMLLSQQEAKFRSSQKVKVKEKERKDGRIKLMGKNRKERRGKRIGKYVGFDLTSEMGY